VFVGCFLFDFQHTRSCLFIDILLTSKCVVQLTLKIHDNKFSETTTEKKIIQYYIMYVTSVYNYRQERGGPSMAPILQRDGF